jgi:hypothetical protein
MTQTDPWSERLASGWIYWPACLGGMLLVGLAVLGPEAERRLDVQRQCAAMQTEVNTLTETRDQLAAVENALQNDPQYLERAVRRELGIVRPGEMRLPQKVGLQASPPQAKPAPPQELPTPLEVAALFGQPHLRFVTMVIGATLMAAGILFSLPGRK